MCGIIGAIGTPKAAEMVAWGLNAEQHRGQEAAGIVSWDGKEFCEHRGKGHVNDVVTRDVLESLRGNSAVGQVLYSTSEGKPEDKQNQSMQIRAQPFTNRFISGALAITHNGNLTNAQTLYRRLLAEGKSFQTSGIDTEVALQLIGSARGGTIVERLQTALPLLEGAYSFILLADDMMIGVRDPLGIRPLSIGNVGTACVMASETCALYAVGARNITDIEPGTMIVIHADGRFERHFFAQRMSPKPCIFEYIYFARPDSDIEGKNVYLIRQAIGRQLAREAPVSADMVVPIPDSGIPHAMGYARQLGIDFEFGLVRSHYVFRTFIEPPHSDRDKLVILKSSPNPALIRGKKIVLCDDSVVRGTTISRIVDRMLDAGAAEVHLRIMSPPWRHGCYWGIDEKELHRRLAKPHISDEEVCATLVERTGAASVAYISVDGMYRAIYGAPRIKACSQACDHCFTGECPTALTDLHGLH